MSKHGIREHFLSASHVSYVVYFVVLQLKKTLLGSHTSYILIISMPCNQCLEYL